MVIGGSGSGVANSKRWGSKCLTLGKQQHFCLGHHFSKHKSSRYAKIWGAWSPGYTYECCTAFSSWEFCTLSYFLQNFTNTCLFHQKWY